MLERPPPPPPQADFPLPKLFVARDIMDDDVPKRFKVPEPKPKPKPKSATKPKAAPKPGPKGQLKQEFRMVHLRKEGFTSQAVAH